MYSEQSKIALFERIGWSNPIQPNTQIVLYAINTQATSGRFNDSFHQLAIVENVYKCINNSKITEADFNSHLYKMQKDCVLEVLNKIFDTNPYAKLKVSNGKKSINYKLDYTQDILDNLSLFDDAIGYAMSVRCLQLFISSTRSNAVERKVAQSYEVLKTELEGVVNQEGVLIAKGANGYYEASIINAINVLFPTEDYVKPRIFGRQPW